MSATKNINRRESLSAAAAASTVPILPRRVMGGEGFVAPSDKVNMALISMMRAGRRV